MTLPETRRGPGRPKGTVTLESSLLRYLEAKLAEVRPPADDGTHWPSKKWQHDILGFAYKILKVAFLTDTQQRVLLAVQESAHDGGRVAVKAGRKVGKDFLAACAALWFYCSFADAQVWLSAPKEDQINDILWRELKLARDRAEGVLDGTWHLEADRGLVSADGTRLIKGRVARTRESAQGYSGRQFLIIDEASGVPQDVFDAFEGNRAGGDVPMLLISNPTKTEGELYDAFHAKKHIYKTFTISSRESPNYVARKIVVPHMATYAWVQQMESVYGKEHAWIKVNIDGEFAEGESGKIIKLETIIAAQQRYTEKVDESGPLVIGLDVAGAGSGGDQTVYAPRRGKRVRIHAFRSLTVPGIVENLRGYIQMYAPSPNEQVVVVVDADGEIGAEVVGALRGLSNNPKERFRLFGVRSGHWAERDRKTYRKTRDELWAWCNRWLIAGGAIPDDAELAQELHAPSWSFDDQNRQQATKKRDGATNLVKMLGRSPDKADAVCLSAWIEGHEYEPSAAPYQKDRIEELRASMLDPFEEEDGAGSGMSIYDAEKTWRR
jgi:hypothetical protein